MQMAEKKSQAAVWMKEISIYNPTPSWRMLMSSITAKAGTDLTKHYPSLVTLWFHVLA